MISIARSAFLSLARSMEANAAHPRKFFHPPGRIEHSGLHGTHGRSDDVRNFLNRLFAKVDEVEDLPLHR